MEKKQIHLIGNAHIDPVWLWRFNEGFAEIKATFKAALDRIREHDTFIFTSACAQNYKWVEENCPALFAEIKEAVKAGRWHIVGGLWIQPDCNIPCSESFARHLLYSQRYFEEKFGVRVTTGYNVDSFGHSAGLPRLFNEGGITNYVFMRPNPYNEMQYPFPNETFRWRTGAHEVVTSRLRNYVGYDTTPYAEIDEDVLNKNESIMVFYGVGNHGGGPTVKTIRAIDAFLPNAKNDVRYSEPDAFFAHMRDTVYDDMPVYEGELQNHASGCYSANAQIKALNRAGENRLMEAERMEVLANALTGAPMHPEKNAHAWHSVLFNQFHDIMCGCADKSAYDDAYAFGGASVAHGLYLSNEAAQRIAWEINTAKGISTLSKDRDWIVWDSEETGAPIVVFNPLSYPVSVPVWAHRSHATAVCDDAGQFVDYQRIRSTWTNGSEDKYCIRFIAELPAYGYRTYWTYNTDRVTHTPNASAMQAEATMLANDRIRVAFDPVTGAIASVTDKNGTALIGDFAARAYVIDDQKNDTWAHNQFVFDEVIGQFGDPVFEVCECGACEASLRVRQTYKSSTLTQTYSLFAGDERIHVSVRLVLNEELVQIKLAFDTGIRDADFIREVPGGIVMCETGGREEPMLRFMAAVKGDTGLAIVNDSKYSASMKNGVLAFIAARSCYFADHYAVRDSRMICEDIGVTEFAYDIVPYHGDLAAVARAACERNTSFPVVPETYHYGTLPQMSSNASIDCDHVILSAVKPAEDVNGIIVRLTEIGNKPATVTAVIFGTTIHTDIAPCDILSFRIADGIVTRVDFTERAK